MCVCVRTCVRTCACVSARRARRDCSMTLYADNFMIGGGKHAARLRADWEHGRDGAVHNFAINWVRSVKKCFRVA